MLNVIIHVIIISNHIRIFVLCDEFHFHLVLLIFKNKLIYLFILQTMLDRLHFLVC